MRRMEGSMIVRHHREPKLLMSEVPRNRMGRLQTGSVKTTFKEPEMLFTHEPQANQPPGENSNFFSQSTLFPQPHKKD